MRRLAHGFLAAGDHHVRLAQFEQPDALDDGTQPGEADLVHGDGGGAERYSCRDGALARGVLARAGRQDLAHDDRVDGGRPDPGAFQGRGDGRGAKLHSAP